MSTFRKYNSIENSYRTKFLESIAAHPCYNEEWCVTEKIHGANFSFTLIQNGYEVEIKPARRNGFMTLEETKNFYKSTRVVSETMNEMKRLFEALKKENKNVTETIVYGELFGGGDYGNLKGQETCIQKGVYYGPNHNFCVFDIYVNEEFLPYDKVCELCQQLNILYAKILFQGELKACLEWSSTHNADVTTIPEILGLGNLSNNIREGHVIKPIKSAFMPAGDRIILKDKNSKFSEVAAASSDTRRKETKVAEESPLLNKYIERSLLYVTKQRYDNLVSKHGPITEKKQIHKYSGLLVQDALEDFEKDLSEEEKNEYLSLAKLQKKKLFLKLQQACVRIIEENRM